MYHESETCSNAKSTKSYWKVLKGWKMKAYQLIILWFVMCYISTCFKSLHCYVADSLWWRCYISASQTMNWRRKYVSIPARFLSNLVELIATIEVSTYFDSVAMFFTYWYHYETIKWTSIYKINDFNTMEQIKSKQMAETQCFNSACSCVARRLRMQTKEALIN